METKYSSKASLFLMELIIAVLFFSISSAICTQMFVKSHLISQQTINENHSVLWIQNISEVFYSNNGDFLDCKNFFKDQQSTISYDFLNPVLANSEDSFSILFDNKWNVVKDSSIATYMVLALYTSDDTFHYLTFITFQLPGSDLVKNTSFNNIQDSSSFIDYLSDQNIWNYSLSIKKYAGMKGETHE